MIKIYITTANTSAPLQLINQSAPQYFKIALITPIKAPPAINPEAINVPRSRRALFTFSSLLRVPTYQLTKPAPRRLPKFRRRRLHNRPSPRHQPKSRRRHPHDRPPHRSLPPNGCSRGGVTWFSVYFRPRRTLRGAASSCCARRRRWLSGSILSVRSTWSRPSPRRIAASASVSRGNTVRRGPTCGFTRKNEFSRFVGNPCCRCVLLASAGRGSLAAVVPLRLLRRDESGAGCGVVFRDLSLSDR